MTSTKHKPARRGKKNAPAAQGPGKRPRSGRRSPVVAELPLRQGLLAMARIGAQSFLWLATVVAISEFWLANPTWGAVLSGARVLTAFQRAGPYWFTTGQRQTGSMTAFGKPPQCDAAHPRCDHPEDLFVDNRPLRHVGAFESLTSGSWYFDYVADRIYVADDPRGHLVETSVVSHAIFATGITGVTIRGLVIEKYANPGQMGAVHADGAVSWRIEGNEIRLNHGAGITLTVSTSCQLTANRIHDNGQLGIGAYSPRLDAFGNSRRGTEVCADMAARLGLHVFDCLNVGSSFLSAVL